MKLPCSWTGCAYVTPDLADALAVQMIGYHADTHKPPPPAPQALAPAPAVREKVKRPSIEAGSSLEKWTYFKSRWNRYKQLANIDDNIVPGHLLECCDEDILLDLHRNHGDT